MGEVTRSRSQGCQVEEGGAGFGSLHPRVRCLIERCGRRSPETVTSPGPPGEQGGAWAPNRMCLTPSPGPSTTPSHEAPAFLAHRILWTRNLEPRGGKAARRVGGGAGPAGPEERRVGPGCAGGKGRRRPGSPGTWDDARKGDGRGRQGGGDAYSGPWRLSGSRAREEARLLGLRTRFAVTPPRVYSGPREPWQRGLYGGRTGPGAAAFTELARSRGQRLLDERSPLPAPRPLPRPHPAFPGRLPFPQIVWTV